MPNGPACSELYARSILEQAEKLHRQLLGVGNNNSRKVVIAELGRYSVPFNSGNRSCVTIIVLFNCQTAALSSLRVLDELTDFRGTVPRVEGLTTTGGQVYVIILPTLQAKQLLFAF